MRQKTQTLTTFGYWHHTHTVVCLSVCDAEHCGYKWYILGYTAKVYEQVNRKCSVRNNFATFCCFSRSQTFTFGNHAYKVASQTPHLLNHRRRCHLANKLKPYCEQGNRQNFYVWNIYRRHAEWLLQTTMYTISSFSVTAGLLVLRLLQTDKQTDKRQENWAIAKMTARCVQYLRLLFPKFEMCFCFDRY